MIGEANDLILVILSREKALLSGIIHAFLDPTCHTHYGLSRSEFLLIFERNVTKKNSYIFALEDSIIIKIVPLLHKKMRINSNHMLLGRSNTKKANCMADFS